MKNWLNRKLGLVSLALSRVEKDAFSQKPDAVSSGGELEQGYHQGMLADSLLRGEITMPVKELRWRLYKVLNQSKSKTAKITGYDADGLPIVETYDIDKYKLDKIIKDDADPYPVVMVVKNMAMGKPTAEEFGNENMKVLDKEEIVSYEEDKEKFDLIGTEKWDARTLGEISFDDMVASMKSKKTLYVERDFRPKFEIEEYTKKLLIRKINENERLLEFYLSEYPDEYNRKTRLLISDIKAAIKNPRHSDLIEFKKVGFITDKVIGAPDGLEFEFEIKKFDKIIKFNGHYVIKFIAEATIDGDNIFTKYKLDELEERYKNKEAK
jgi:hypothetical protein